MKILENTKCVVYSQEDYNENFLDAFQQIVGDNNASNIVLLDKEIGELKESMTNDYITNEEIDFICDAISDSLDSN